MNTEIMIKREVAVKMLLVRVRQKSYYNKKMVKVREVQNKFIRENDNFISLIFHARQKSSAVDIR